MKLIHKVLILLSIWLAFPFEGFSGAGFEMKTINLSVPENSKHFGNSDELLKELLNAGSNNSWLAISSEKDKASIIKMPLSISVELGSSQPEFVFTTSLKTLSFSNLIKFLS